ncbi:unnamed protein product [Dracunculus medinensis]|uniref:BCL7-like protein C28H8.1 n=1 Tax=Dracunculus medinensis TaxID=318479 RepID=A0A0N4UA70_DRAME|nr:unnamed protein product [Dracunculus medinensis]
MYARNQRAETRNRAKDELKRVINSLDKVRKWEKKWIILKDTQIKMYKWMPVTAGANIPKASAKSTIVVEENNTALSGENTRDSTTLENSNVSRIRNFENLNDDSNLGFSEGGFDSDSNQTLEPTSYSHNAGSTDFSAMRQQEMAPNSK